MLELPLYAIKNHEMQYCAKVMRANFDEIRALFLQFYSNYRPIFRTNFRNASAKVRRFFDESSKTHSKFRINDFSKKRNINDFSPKGKKISANFRAVTENNVGSDYHASYLCLRLTQLRRLRLHDVSIISLTSLILVFITLQPLEGFL
ncbi:MAG: hypothetical protein OIF58_09690, partial [Cohaesibacter sp.]|nr:hypothetical protein [Cohaesibacter sp.]